MVPRASVPAFPLVARLTAALGGLFRSGSAGRGAGASTFAAHLSGARARAGCATVSPTAPHAPPKRASGRDEPREDDVLDPVARHAAQLAPPAILALPAPPSLMPAAVADPGGAPALRAMTSLEEILPQLVRRLSMTGDGRRGAVRVEIGTGALAGSTLLVSAEDGRLRVELSAPSTVDAASWRDRIASRLAARGLVVDEVLVQTL